MTATGKLQQPCNCANETDFGLVYLINMWLSILYLYLSQGSDDESYVSDVSDNISEDNASVTDNVSRQSRSTSFHSLT